MTDASKPLSALREQLAKAMFEYEVTQSHGDKGAKWPDSSAIQPYCQWAYREADALLPIVTARDADLIREAQAEAFERAAIVADKRIGMYLTVGLDSDAHAAKEIGVGIRAISPDPNYRQRIQAQARIEMVEKCRTAVSGIFPVMGNESQTLWDMFNNWKKQLEAELERLAKQGRSYEA